MRIIIFILTFIRLNSIYGQIVCSVTSPSIISGNYAFSWGTPLNTWASMDLSISGNYITGELMLVDDGSVGNSPASGLPLSNYGCAPLQNNLTGKIAVVYRYDGVTNSTICWMSEKAKYAQDAGAIGVVIINRPGASADIGNGGGTSAPLVTIPVVLISYEDGAIIRNELQNGPVSMFIGNKTGLYANDLTLNTTQRLISPQFGVSSQLALNGNEFSIDLGVRAYNFGSTNQNNVFLTAKIFNPLGQEVYNNQIGPYQISINDSLDVYPNTTISFPVFSLPSYLLGRYKIRYEVSMDVSDDYPGDNFIESDFIMNDSIISYARLNESTNLPIALNYYRPSSGGTTYSQCAVFNNSNASRIAVQGLYFSAATGYNSGFTLDGEEMQLSLYEWNDAFADLNDPNLAFNNLSEIAVGYYYYPSDLQNQVVYSQLDNPVILQDNKRYLTCITTVNPNIYLGCDVNTNYVWNESYYLQPMFPISNDGTFFAAGFGADIVPAIAIKIMNSNEVGTEELTSEKIEIYPNPTFDELNVKGMENKNYIIIDQLGRIVQSGQINSENPISIKNFDSGSYSLKIGDSYSKILLIK
jgi:hypothetical protein